LFIALDNVPHPSEAVAAAAAGSNLRFVGSLSSALRIRARKTDDREYTLEATLSDDSARKGYLAVSQDNPDYARYRAVVFVTDPESLSRTPGNKIWYQDFKIADKASQPLEIGLPGQWATHRGMGTILLDGQ
jgi:hypothetical protein